MDTVEKKVSYLETENDEVFTYCSEEHERKTNDKGEKILEHLHSIVSGGSLPLVV